MSDHTVTLENGQNKPEISITHEQDFRAISRLEPATEAFKLPFTVWIDDSWAADQKRFFVSDSGSVLLPKQPNSAQD